MRADTSPGPSPMTEERPAVVVGPLWHRLSEDVSVALGGARYHNFGDGRGAIPAAQLRIQGPHPTHAGAWLTRGSSLTVAGRRWEVSWVHVDDDVDDTAMVKLALVGHRVHGS